MSGIQSSPVAKLVEAARTPFAEFVAAVRAFLASEECNPETVAAAYHELDRRSLEKGVLAHAYVVFAKEVTRQASHLAYVLPRDVPQGISEFTAREHAKRLAERTMFIVAHLKIPPEVRGSRRRYPLRLT